jgi:hypothetical protein
MYVFALIDALKTQDVDVYHARVPPDDWDDCRVRLDLWEADYLAIRDETDTLHLFSTEPRVRLPVRKLADPGVMGFMWLKYGREATRASERWARILGGVIG